MDQRTLILVIAVVAIVLVAAIYLISRRSKGALLKQKFGDEYDRVVAQRGDTRAAEAELAEREKRVNSFSIRGLSPADRDVYAAEWSSIQRRFVDGPSDAVLAADRLTQRVMTDRGYPMSDFEQRAADISVSYPAVVQNYRSAHEIALRQGGGGATTEELRRAIVHYRSLFDELLDTRTVTDTRNDDTRNDDSRSVEARPVLTEDTNRKIGVTHERAS